MMSPRSTSPVLEKITSSTGRYSRHFHQEEETWSSKREHRSPSPHKSDGLSSKRIHGDGDPSGGNNKTSTTNKPSLAQEITDEFLICKICLEAYKNPKCLECLHTFCEQCIDTHVQSESSYKKYSDYREFTCPLCRKRTQVPIGGVKKLQDNFLVSSLSEVVGRRRISKFPFCDICRTVEQKYREGTAKCLDCAKMLCPSCVTAHQEIKVTSGHSIFDIEIEKDIGCQYHPEEMVRFYCEPCELCICVLCTFKEHREHKMTQFGEAVTQYKSTMEILVDKCTQKIDQFDSYISTLTRCDDVIQATRQKIKETSANFIQETQRREEQLLEEVNNIYGGDCIEYIEQKTDLVNQVENLRSTSKLAQTILHGKDIELLLLRKEVEEKLRSLQATELKRLPSTTSKVIEFISGSVDLGYLYDREKPLLSTMTLKKKMEQLDQERTTLVVPQELRTTEIKIGIGKHLSAKKSSDKSSSRSSRHSDSSDDDDSDDSDSDASDDSDKSDSSEDSSKSGSSIASSQSGILGGRDCGVQTVISGSSGNLLVPKSNRSTMTDRVTYHDKAINTKARSMINPGKGGGGGAGGGGGGGSGNAETGTG